MKKIINSQNSQISNNRSPHRQGAPSPGEVPPRLASALLEALAGEGAYGWIDDSQGAEALVVAASRRGVSVRVARFDPAVGVALVGSGLALWETGAVSGRRRLVIADVGRSRLTRDLTDGNDPFLRQHKPLARDTIGHGGARVEVIVDQAESPLFWLATRKTSGGKPLIDKDELEAGERLRRDFTFAGMEPRVTANWSANGSSGSRPNDAGAYSDLAIAARQRVEAALDFVGADFAGLLLDVCGFLKGLETVESERHWPRRSAKLVLVLALRQLARHYGIGAVATGPRRSTGLRHWGAADYRPEISSDDPG